MEYFILEQDRRIHNSIHIPVLMILGKSDYQNLNLAPLPRMTLLIRQGYEHESYPDMLSQLFMVSKSLNEVISLFMQDAEYKLFCFWDQKKNKDFYYYAYSPYLVDCLSEKSVIRGGGKIVERAMLKRGAIPDIDIIRVDKIDTHLILVSLPVAEAILRRKFSGLRLLKTYFEDEEEIL